jgi:hypothetical protein
MTVYSRCRKDGVNYMHPNLIKRKSFRSSKKYDPTRFFLIMTADYQVAKMNFGHNKQFLSYWEKEVTS